MHCINLAEWSLAGFWPHEADWLGIASGGNGSVMSAGVTGWIPARVPGGVHADLLRAGLIDDPYYGMNSLACEWVENRTWIYKTNFRIDSPGDGKHIHLVFDGVDYSARFFLNGELLGSHTGMYLAQEFDITEKVKYSEDNLLVVIFNPPPREQGQIGFTSRTFTQKSRFGYKWDFSTRLVNVGLYAPAHIDIDDGVVCRSAWVRTEKSDAAQTSAQPGEAASAVQSAASAVQSDGVPEAAPRVRWVLRADTEWSADEPFSGEIVYSLRLDGELAAYRRADVSLPAGRAGLSTELPVYDPALWHANGAGAQPLYTFSAELYKAGAVCAKYECRTAFRTLDYFRADGAGGEALPYGVSVNGKRTYIKGVNMVPLDHMYGTVTRERYAELLNKAKSANINLIRVWGGGLIESEDFYSLCDERGILVWQDFIQSSSGLDNVPGKSPEFLALLRRVSERAVKVKRNHPCLAFWCGGNELIQPDGVPSTVGDENVAMLRDIVSRLDPGRMFLPTTASGPREGLDPSDHGRNHDVHGPWTYSGPEAHYKLYNESDSMLHSEFGVDGPSCEETLRRSIPERDLRAVTMKESAALRHRGAWWDCYGARDRELFGELAPDDVASLVKLGQFMQTEGLRYAVEANRRRAFSCVGNMIWQLNEPWPNACCTSLVDFFGNEKPALAAVGRAYAPLAASLRYDRLIYERGDRFNSRVFVANDGPARSVRVTADIVAEDGSRIFKGEFRAVAPENGVAEIGKLAAVVRGCFTVTLTLDGVENRYAFLCGAPEDRRRFVLGL